MTVTNESPEDEHENRPKIASGSTPLRKLFYKQGGFVVNLGKVAKDAGFERGDKVIPDISEDGSIALLEVEDPENPPDDARSLKGDSLRMNVPPSLLSPLGITSSSYDHKEDPAIFYLEGFPDEDELPSAVELTPIGFASGVLDEENRLLPPEERDPLGDQAEPEEEVGTQEKGPVGRQLTDVGIAPNILETVATHHPVSEETFWQGLEQISQTDPADLDEHPEYEPLEGEGRRVIFVEPVAWTDLAAECELDDDVVKAAKFAHNREAEQLVGEEEAEDHRGFSDDVEAVVLPF